MKKLLFITCLLFCLMSVSAKSSSGFEIQFNRTEFDISRSKNDTVTVIPKTIDYSYDNSSSLSGLPRKIVNIWLPKNSVDIEYSIISRNRTLLFSGVDIASAPADIPTSCTIDNYESYSGDDSFTQNNLKASESVQTISFSAVNSNSKGSLAHFSMCPFEYDKATRSLYLITNLRFIVAYDEDSRGSYKQNRWNPEMTEALSNMASLAVPLATGNFSEYQEGTSVELDYEGLDYAIITSSALSDAFNDIVNWKNTKGVRTEIIKIEDINARRTGNSLQEKIKQEIQYLFKYRGLKYVLLGGDDSVVPVRLCRATCAATHGDIPADLYYVCFNGNFNWDGNNNGIYGEKDDSIDFTASLFISRLPVRTAHDITAYSNKLLKYEMAPLNADIKKNLLSGGTRLYETSASGTQSDALKKGELLYSEYIEPYWDGQRIRFFDTQTDFPDGASYDFSAQNLQCELSKGYSFIDIITHGKTNNWTMETEMDYSASLSSSLNNSGYSHIATAACFTNEFDSNTDPCLSESFIRNPNSGVLTFLGSSRQGWISKINYSLGPSLQYEAEYYKELFNQDTKYKNFAKLVFAAKSARISTSKWNDGQRWIQFSLNAIGDAEMYIYTDIPKIFAPIDISYNHDDRNLHIISQDYFNVTVTTVDENQKRNYSTIKNTKYADFKNINDDALICFTYPGYAPVFKKLKVFKDSFTISTISSAKLATNGVELFTYNNNHENIPNVAMHTTTGTQFIDIIVDINNTNPNSSYIIQVHDVMGNIKYSDSLKLSDSLKTRIPVPERGFYVVSLISDNKIICFERVYIK